MDLRRSSGLSQSHHSFLRDQDLKSFNIQHILGMTSFLPPSHYDAPHRACSDISITPGGSQKLNSGFFDFNFGNDLNNVGSRWSKPDPLGGERLLHQGGWNPVPAPLQPQPGTSMVQSPALSSWSSPTSLKNPDTPSWMGLRQTYKPITSNQVARSKILASQDHDKENLTGVSEQDGCDISPVAATRLDVPFPVCTFEEKEQHLSTSFKLSTSGQQEELFSVAHPKQTTPASHETKTTSNGGEKPTSEKTNQQAKVRLEKLDQHLVGTKDSNLAAISSSTSAAGRF